MKQRTLLSLALFALCFLFVENAEATCGNHLGPKPKVLGKLPAGGNHKAGPPNHSIVGLWQVTYYLEDSVWDMSFDTWHSDGTENDNDMTPPALSAVCEGVWEQTGPQTYKLHHVGWAWDASGFGFLGYFILDEVNTFGSDGNSYTGFFTFQVYDLDGKPIGASTTGTIGATRITVGG